MAINYPNSLDNFTNPTSSSPINSPSHADQHSNANDAIEALEAKVGVTGSAVSTSHDYKITQLESLVTSAVAGAKSIYQDVRNQSGSSLSKATPVYASGSEGASGKILVSPASNSAESSSSKTIGLTSSAISNNSNGQIISEGILEGVDTTGAVDGDPVWLGPNGTKIFGLVNKPSAPSHLVFLGIVVRGGQANTGSIYVKIQNGFELQELHNVQISSLLNGNILAYDSTSETWKNTNTLQSTASTVPLVIKGSTSQSANLQEWQNSAGTVLAKVDKDGSITSNISFTVNNTSGNAIFSVSPYSEISMPGTIYGGLYASAKLNLLTNNSSTIGIIVRGYASQTANLQEWQDSTGAILSYITASGALRINSAFGGTQAAITAGSAATIGLIVRAAASQSANLQEWQNSGGTALAWFTSNGTLNVRYARATTNDSTVVPLIVKGAASQSANLQEWQDSSGSVSTRIGAAGQFVGNNFLANGIGGTISGTMWTVISGSSGYVPIIAKGAASQTAKLQEWQNSAGTVVASTSVEGNGYFQANLNAASIGAGNNIGGATLTASPWGASTIVSIIRGYPSQNADLTQWQNSSGTIIAGVSPIGQSFVQTTAPITASAVAQSITAVSFTPTTATYTFSATDQTISIGEYVTVYGIAPSGYNGTYKVTAVATVSAGSSYSFTVANTTNDTVTTSTGYFYPSASLSISTQNKAHTGLIVKGVTGQTAAIMEIQNSLSQPVTWWDSTGGMTASQAVISTLYSGGYMNTGTLGYFNATTFSPSVRPIVVRGAASQTANLQEWQNSSGTVLAQIQSTGAFNTSWAGSFGTLSNLSSTTLGVVALNSTIVPLVAKGAASQTADLQQWQDSTGAVITKVNSIGRMTINSSSDAGGAALYVIQPNGGYGVRVLGAGTSGAALWVDTVAGGVGAIIRAAASQTANLQEWQNSSGTVMASISASGSISQGSSTNYTLLDSAYGQVSIRAGGNLSGSLTVGTGAASITAIIVKGAASQSANLQEWQNSSGTALVTVSSTGFINTSSGIGTATTSYMNGIADSAASKMVLSFNSTSYGLLLTNIQAAGVGFIVKGAASQSANLQEWQNSAGTALLSVASNGFLTGSGSSQFNVNGDFTANYITASKNLFVNSTNNEVKAIIRGNASQTANLQEWQNSSGTVLASVLAGGNLQIATSTALISSATISTTTPWFAAVDNNYSNLFITYSGTDASVANGNIGGRITFGQRFYSGNAGTFNTGMIGSIKTSANGEYSGGLTFHTNQGFTFTEKMRIDGLGTVTINGFAAGAQGLIVKGAVSQTANLQEWQNSDGANLALMTSGGFLHGTGFRIKQNANSTISSAQGSIEIQGPTVRGLVIVGATSQTASLQEWHNSSGTALSYVDNNGNFRTPIVAAVTSGLTLLRTNYDTNGIGITPQAAAQKGLIIRGATSQTANLQEWQNSDGTVNARIASNGDFTNNGIFTVYGRFGGASFTDAAALRVNGYDTAVPTAVIKAIASQTSNLQEWQNSSGTVLNRINSAGHLIASSRSIFGGATSIVSGMIIAAVSQEVAATPILARGASGQTANLQEWQNSTGSVLASISANGTINTSLLKVQNIIDSSSGGPTLQFNNSSINIWTFTAASIPLIINAYAGQTSDLTQWKNSSANVTLSITPDGSIRGGNSSTISVNTATTVDTVALSSFTTIEYVISIKQGSKIRSSKVLVHTDGTSVDSTEYGIMEMGGGITGILVSASVSSTNSILQVTITDAATTNATVKLIKTML